MNGYNILVISRLPVVIPEAAQQLSGISMKFLQPAFKRLSEIPACAGMTDLNLEETA